MIREMNFLQDGDVLPFGEMVENSTLERVYDQAKHQSRFEELQQEIEEFNSRNRWRKRGLSINPVKFG